MRNRIVAFISLFVFWVILTWSLSIEEMLAGLLFSLAAALITEKVYGTDGSNINPVKYLWFVYYAVLLLWDITKACADALVRLASPSQNAKPRILEIKTALTNGTALGILSATASMLPGVISLEADRSNNILRVYCLACKTELYSSVIELSLFKYETILKKVFA